MSTTDTNISNLIINQMSKSALDDLVSNSNVPANQVFVTPDDGLNIAITTTQGQENISDGTNTLSFGANAFNSTNIPTNASDVGALANSTKYGASLSVSGQSLQLKDQNGNNLGSAVTTQDTDTGATSVGLRTGDTGNVLTNMSYNASDRKITFEKGITALTSHQDISGKADKGASAVLLWSGSGTGEKTLAQSMADFTSLAVVLKNNEYFVTTIPRTYVDTTNTIGMITWDKEAFITFKKVSNTKINITLSANNGGISIYGIY